jgi:broad specificity phosphatase PhoE
MKIVLVRHGESVGNVARLINDDPLRQVNLTERGRAQAEATATALREVRFTHAYASEFPRARQTAAILLRHHALQLNIDARLNERRSGMDGQHVDAFNKLVAANPLYFKPSHGESFREQMERLRSFLDEIASLHADGCILAVSHENPIVAVLALLSDEPELEVHRHLDNCECVEVVWPAVRSV